MFDAYPVHAADRLEAIAEAFGSPRSGQTTMHLAYIFGFLAILVIIALIAKYVQRLKEDDPVKRRERALTILDQALRNRSRIDVSFHPEDTGRLIISCVLENVGAERITLELPGGVSPSTSWIGKSILCFFRIPGDSGRPFFYKFSATIIDMRVHGDIHYLDLALPDQVELGQKRRHMRLDLPENDIMDFRVWPGSGDQILPCETDPDKWPDPLAVYRQDQGSPLHILDLSGGGIRLEYDPRQFPSLNDFLRSYPTLFMRLELVPMASKLPCIYYMTARLRTKQENFKTGSFMLGYEFVECGQTQAEGNIKWITIEPDHGIEDLVTWIFKRHLELYREREVE